MISASAVSRNGVRVLAVHALSLGSRLGFARPRPRPRRRPSRRLRGPGCRAARWSARRRSDTAPSDRRGLVGRVDAVLQLHGRLAREEERQSAHAVSDERDAELLELLRRRGGIDDRLRSRADQQPRRARELQRGRRSRRDRRPDARRRCRRSPRPRSPPPPPPRSWRSRSSRPALRSPPRPGGRGARPWSRRRARRTGRAARR